MGKIFGIFVFILILTQNAVGQIDLIEKLLESELEYYDQSSALEFIEYLSANPINVNSAGIDRLIMIPGITVQKANKIVARRTETGGFSNLDQVRETAGFGEEFFSLIRSFLVIEGNNSKKLDIRQRFFRKVEKSEGYVNERYTGTPFRNYTRINFSNGTGFRSGLITEKDPGENSFNDHLKGYVYLLSANKNTAVIIGDYSLSISQGLLFDRSFGFGKSNDPVKPVLKVEKGARGYTSSLESEGFRGIHLRSGKGRFEYNVFYSNLDRDARINDEGFVTSLDLAGYHRTQTEQEHQDALAEKLTGARVIYNIDNNSIFGITSSHIRYDRYFVNKNPQTDPFRFSGSKVNINSIDFKIYNNEYVFFGEAGLSNEGAPGIVLGTIYSESETNVGILYRYYSPEFYSPFGHSFTGSGNQNRNEKGIYIGVEHKLNSTMTASFYADYYKTPDKQKLYQKNKTSKDFFAQFEYNSKSDFVLTYKRGYDQERYSSINEYNISEYVYEDKISNRIKIRNRIPVVNIGYAELKTELKNTKEYDGLNGNIGFVSTAKARFFKDDLGNVTCSLTYFDTKENSIYNVESDLPGMLAIKQLKGKGQRYYLLCNIKLSSFKLSGKYGLIYYSDRDTVGSGDYLIQKNYYQEIGFQIDYVIK